MTPTYKVPGVYREDVFLKPQPALPTGIPGFVGFVDASSEFNNQAIPLHRKDDFELRSAKPGDPFRRSLAASYLADAITGFFQNGGVRCYVVPAELGPDREAAMKNGPAASHEREVALVTALESLAPLTDVDLIAVPDAMTLKLSESMFDTAAIERVQKETLLHCEKHGGRLAILDSLHGASVEAVKRQRTDITAAVKEPVNGALYFPWLKVSPERLVPPCGHVAGIFARSDAKAGVFKAPANEELSGVVDLETPVNNSIQDQLNPEGINCLRAFPGRGIRVWGARTISNDDNWRYINVRRLVLTLQRWIDANMAWATLEPNTPRLWVRISRELSAHLDEIWRAGGLAGRTAEQAYFVKCDAETNPAEAREVGKTITEIGLAPNAPTEFIVVRVIHPAGVEPR